MTALQTELLSAWLFVPLFAHASSGRWAAAWRRCGGRLLFGGQSGPADSHFVAFVVGIGLIDGTLHESSSKPQGRHSE